jgi:iron complex outermembrane receptor protein
LFFSPTRYTQKTFQEGLDLTFNPIGDVDVIVGGTYFDDKTASVVNSVSGGVLGSIGTGGGHSKAWAAFGDLTYHATDRLTLNAGGRYTEETRRVQAATLLVATQRFTGVPIDVSNKYTNFSPRGSIRYEVAPHTNVYASFSKGFRAGTVQGIATATQQLAIPIKPELVTAYEAGLKHYSRLLSFDASAFYYDYKNIQVSVTIPNPLTGQPTSTLQNGATAKIYGFESQLTLRPVKRLELSLSGTLLHAHYGDFRNATAVGLNTTTMLNVPGQIQDLSGQQMIRAPNFSGTAAVDYTVEKVAGGSLNAAANVKYTDSYVVNNPSLYGPLAGALANKERFRQSGYALVNGSLTWTDASDHFSLGIWGNNLTNKKVRLSNNAGAFGEYGIWGWPRQVGVRAGVKF